MVVVELYRYTLIIYDIVIVEIPYSPLYYWWVREVIAVLFSNSHIRSAHQVFSV